MPASHHNRASLWPPVPSPSPQRPLDDGASDSQLPGVHPSISRRLFRRARRLLAPVWLGVAAACATAAPSPEEIGPDAPLGARGDTHTLTEADLAAAPGSTLLDVIRAQRPRWLQTPITTSGRSTSIVSVFIGTARAGDIAALGGIEASLVARVRYYDATEAQQRLPGGDLGPVIQVVLK